MVEEFAGDRQHADAEKDVDCAGTKYQSAREEKGEE
jgi:hypothetical protein